MRKKWSNYTVILFALIWLWYVHQMRMVQSGLCMVQSGITIAIIRTLIWLWCVRQMRKLQSGMMITVRHSYIDMTVVCTWKVYASKWITYASKWNYDNGHTCIDKTVVCTSNAYDSKCNNDSGHSCMYSYDYGVYVKCVRSGIIIQSILLHWYDCGMYVKCAWFKVDYVWFKVE